MEPGSTQAAPAQRLTDFVEGRPSRDLPECSYLPGVTAVDLNRLLPKMVAKVLRKGFIEFDRKLRGFIHEDAIVVAPESRTSSPVRIPRDKITVEHQGFGFVEFRNEDDADYSIKIMHMIKLYGKPIKVNFLIIQIKTP